ncbi:MAG: SRPBCC domain-containing protein [Dehalococcoidia bacterium]
MKFEHTITIPAAIEEVRTFFDDVPAVAACVPGVEGVTQVEPDVYDGRVRLRVGPLAFTIAGRAHVERAEDGAWRMRGEGRDSRVGAGVSAALEARLREIDAGTTEVEATADLQFSGRLGELGQPLIRRKADSMLEEFTENLQQAFA